ncbi:MULTISPECIES: hypothetical protein [Thalassospira]|jgi:hypothetical protein|uniref:hypothetical protein n=1 Tax=Thalassospira TaxID=168934 RepID=UPI0008DCA86F|nr:MULTISPECIES: hypothetical protein [Thalassospira]MDM7975248.1 hypothetical protein [Thalassospira xiamenensis]OHZ00971.1 hypothetical protein BC440_09015 [Thalassospira sp. MIT1004]QPL37494.1 hypothetical protein IT971_09475 [Thalassospira sp. B30-1]
MAKKRRTSGAATKWVAVLDDQNILRGIREVALDEPGVDLPAGCDLLEQKSLFRYIAKTGQFKPIRDKMPCAEDAMIAIIDALENAGISMAPVATDWRDFRNKRKAGSDD